MTLLDDEPTGAPLTRRELRERERQAAKRDQIVPGIRKPPRREPTRRAPAANKRPTGANAKGAGTHPPKGARSAKKRKPAFSFVGFLGELLMFGGVFMLTFVGWKMYWQPETLGNEQAAAAVTITNQLQQSRVEPASLDQSGIPTREIPKGTSQQFGVLYMPGLRSDWMRPLIASVEYDDLASNIGHYPQTQSPGEVGNFALAGHRTGWGNPFVDLPSMKVGSRMYVETIDGWYVYEYRNGSYVTPSAVEILNPVPMAPEIPVSGDRIITLQTCNPPNSGAPERFIAYGVMIDFVPRSQGVPDEVRAIQAENGVSS